MLGIRFLLILSIILGLVCIESVLSENKNETVLEQTKGLNESIGEKLKRLKDLRAQTKALAAELRQSKIEKIISGNEFNSTVVEDSKGHRLKRWKKRIQKRISQLTKRLAKLERAVISQQTKIEKVLKSPKIGAKNRKLSSRVTKSRNSTLLTTTEQNMITTNAIPQNKSRPGDHQSLCSTHNDCSPGHCCHKFEQSSKCIRHALNETSVCRHSCQCESHLQCFRKNDVNGEIGQSHCKKAHRNDVHGSYENSKMGIFEDE